MQTWKFYPSYDPPAALDIVWCRFPLVEDPDNPGPKPRPALVRRVLNKNDNIYIEISFGTSNTRRYSDKDLYIANLSNMIDAGLPQATIFQLERTVIIPWAEEWCFEREDGTGPVVGHLNQICQEYLRHILSRRKP